MKKTIEVFLLIGTPLAALLWNYRGDYFFNLWLGPWAVLLVGVSLAIAYFVGLKIHPSLTPAIAVLLASGVLECGYSFLSRDAAYSIFGLLSLITLFSFLEEKHDLIIRTAIAGLYFFHLIQALFDAPIFTANASMTGSLIAFTMPMIVFSLYEKETLLPLSILALSGFAILQCNASVPVGVFMTAIVFWAIARLRESRANVTYALALVFGFFGLAYGLIGPDFFDSNHRFEFWRQIYTWWKQSGNFWFGSGTGTGSIIFQTQATIEGASRVTFWAHNDWLQVLFENGVVGLSAVALVWGYALKAAIDRPWLFSAIGAYGACAFFNFPAHLPAHAFVGVAYVWLAHRGEKYTYGQN